MNATFNIMFFIQKGKVTANGRAPIFARLTVNGERVHFSTKLSIQPDRWDAKNYCTLGKTKDEKNINGFLDELKCSIQRHYFDLQAAGDVVSASKIKKMMFCTEEHRCVSVKEIFDRFIEDYTKQVQMNKAGVMQIENNAHTSKMSIKSSMSIIVFRYSLSSSKYPLFSLLLDLIV